MIDTGLKFYAEPSTPHTWPSGQGHRLRTFMLKFYVKVFRTSLFLNSVVYLFHVWHDDRCWSKIFCSTIPKPVYDFKVTVTDLKFLYCNFFTISVFLQSLQWILFVYGVMIEPCLMFYVVPSPSQYMALRSRSGTLSGWLGRAMVLGSFQCWGVLLLWQMVGQGPAVLAAGAGLVGYVFF